MVVAQAQKVEQAGDSIVFTFAPAHRALRARLEEKRAWIEQLALTATGRKILVTTKDGDPLPASAPAPSDSAAAEKAAGLKARAKAEPSVQAVLDWDRQNGPVIGANNQAQLGIRPLRGVDLTVTGNLDLRWMPVPATGTASPSGSIMLNLDILELIGD